MCLGTKAPVWVRVNRFLSGLPARNAEAKRRRRDVPQPGAGEFLRNSQPQSHSNGHPDPALA